jgi:hypothetical protein
VTLQFRLFEEDGNEVSGAVFWGIINDDYLIVFVVLVDDWLEVIFVPVVFCVIVGCHHYANGQLGGVEIEMVLVIQSLNLFLDLFLHVSSLEGVDEGRAEVEPAEGPGVS